MPSGGHNILPRSMRKNRRRGERPKGWKKKERWKLIEYPGFENLYEVSNMGRVRRLPRKVNNKSRKYPMIMSPWINGSNDAIINLHGRNLLSKFFLLKILVADHWITYRDKRLPIIYLDPRDKFNCSIYNIRQSGPLHLTNGDKRAIIYILRELGGKPRGIYTQLSKFFGIDKTCIFRFIQRWERLCASNDKN